MRVEAARAEAERARERAAVVRLRLREAQALELKAQENTEEMQALMEASRFEALADRLKEAQIQVEVVKRGSGGR